MKNTNTTCPICGLTYYRFPSQIKKGVRVTCSRTCGARQFKDKGDWVPCQCCGVSFYRTKSLADRGFGKFCSRKCEAASRPNPSVECICGYCNTKFMKPWWDVNKCGGGKFCSRKCIDTFKRKL